MAAGKGAIRLARAAVLSVTEATPYTAETLAAPGIMCYDVNIDIGDNNSPRTDYSNHYGKLAEVVPPRWGKVTFKQALLTAGALASQIYNKQIVAHAGHKVTFATGVDTQIRPWTTIAADTGTVLYPHICTFGVWEESIVYKFKGCSPAGAALVWEMGKAPYWEFAFQGSLVGITDEAVGSVTTSSVPPVPLIGATCLTIDSVNLAMTSFRIDYNYSVGKLVSLNDANGIVGFSCTDRRLRAKFDPSMEKVSDYNYFNKWALGTQLATTLTAGSATNRYTLTCNLQLDAPKPSTREMIRTLDIDASVISSGSEGDDFLLKFD